MRKILLIHGGEATPLNETKFTEEGKLQDYLEEYPTLIPLADIVEGASNLICIGREVGAGSGSIDLLCIDKDSLLTVIETKLRRNREARREVVGQIIEYASYVYQWTADDIYRIANEYFAKSEKAPQNYRGKTLDEVMREIVGGEFSEDDFRTKIGQNLRDGRLRLVIAVDELIEPLRAMITFLNSHSNFDILLLQVTDFEESKDKRVFWELLLWLNRCLVFQVAIIFFGILVGQVYLTNQNYYMSRERRLVELQAVIEGDRTGVSLHHLQTFPST